MDSVLDIATVLIPLAVFTVGMLFVRRRGSTARAQRGVSTEAANQAMGLAILMAAALLIGSVSLDGSALETFFEIWLVVLLAGNLILRRRRRVE